MAIIKKLTDEKWINLYNVSYENKNKEWNSWIFASRKSESEINKKENKPDAVVIVPFYKRDNRYSLIVIKEYRPPIGDYEFGFPAGLIDENETPEETAKRELKEETGLNVAKVLHISSPTFSSAGITDESIVYVFVECNGNISTKENEASEDIQVLKCSEHNIKTFMSKKKKISSKLYPILIMIKVLGLKHLVKRMKKL